MIIVAGDLCALVNRSRVERTAAAVRAAERQHNLAWRSSRAVRAHHGAHSTRFIFEPACRSSKTKRRNHKVTPRRLLNALCPRWACWTRRSDGDCIGHPVYRMNASREINVSGNSYKCSCLPCKQRINNCLCAAIAGTIQSLVWLCGCGNMRLVTPERIAKGHLIKLHTAFNSRCIKYMWTL